MPSDVSNKHQLSDGRSVWIQHIVIPDAEPGDKTWSVVVASPILLEAPEITQFSTEDECLDLLAEILRADFLDQYL